MIGTNDCRGGNGSTSSSQADEESHGLRWLPQWMTNETDIPLLSRTTTLGSGRALVYSPSLHEVEMGEKLLRTGEDIVERFSKSESSSAMISSVGVRGGIMSLVVPQSLRTGFQHDTNLYISDKRLTKESSFRLRVSS